MEEHILIPIESQPSQLLVENLNHHDQDQDEQADYWSRINIIRIRVTKIIRKNQDQDEENYVDCSCT